MMKRIIFYNLLIVICLAGACKKIDVEPADGLPVFNAAFLVDGSLVQLEGGVDSFYMFTSFEKDANDVYSFIGRMEREGCDSFCGDFLEIQIRDFQAVPPNVLNIAEALSIGNHQFVAPIGVPDTVLNIVDVGMDYKVNFYADSIGVNPVFSSFQWEFSNGELMTGSSAVFLYDTLMPSPVVTLRRTEFDGGDSCVVTQTQYLEQDVQDRCKISILPVTAGSILEDLLVVPNGSNISGWIWNNGETDSFLMDSLLVLEPEYLAEVMLEGNCEGSATFQNFGVTSPNVLANCQVDFGYNVEELIIQDSVYTITPADNNQFGRVRVIYSNGNEIFDSKNNVQPVSSSFEIIAVEDFDENENGFPTKKVTLRFNCLLWNDAGDVNNIEVVSDVIWGVAYPE